MRNKRVSDQILILESIACVREELTEYNRTMHDMREGNDIMERLMSLYACLNPDKITEVLKQHDERGKYGK